ncbi:NADPH--cytochrome P450 reductase [Toxocara canis]|uniref:NADPH--hemoprotein reductase n=1 Tax=Toxocara canis TaxID=6265 RepID=A0A0B2V8G6_TOXCA|nr:NADPH--cytochrome P450 reductase [Toxocara canis]
MGKFFDRRLEELGAKRVYELGLGDDDGNLEEDFMRWREGFWPAIAQSFGWQISEEAESERQYRFEIVKDPAATAIFIGEYGRIGAFEKQRPWREGFWPAIAQSFGWQISEEAESERQYRFEIVKDPAATAIFIGEYGRIGAFEKQRPPFDQKNPYLAVVGVNRELHKEKSDRSCRHIEFITNGARVRYEAGDHLGVFPTNDAILVEEFGRLLNVDMNLTFRLINLDGCENWPTVFPFEKVMERIVQDYDEMNIAEKEIEKWKQARYYSISSSPKLLTDAVAVTAVITKYTIGDRLIKGVCTNYLLAKKEGDKVPVFVRKSTLRLPHRSTTAIIMIGPGTGFAPFRGFIQERQWIKQQGR